MYLMLYAIIGEDGQNSLALRLQVRPRHLEYLRLLQAEGRLVLAGPFPAVDSPEPGDAGFKGSLVIAEFADLAAAEAWAQGDPYATEGVFRSVEVRPFKQVLP